MPIDAFSGDSGNNFGDYRTRKRLTEEREKREAEEKIKAKRLEGAEEARFTNERIKYKEAKLKIEQLRQQLHEKFKSQEELSPEAKAEQEQILNEKVREIITKGASFSETNADGSSKKIELTPKDINQIICYGTYGKGVLGRVEKDSYERFRKMTLKESINDLFFTKFADSDEDPMTKFSENYIKSAKALKPYIEEIKSGNIKGLRKACDGFKDTEGSAGVLRFGSAKRWERDNRIHTESAEQNRKDNEEYALLDRLLKIYDHRASGNESDYIDKDEEFFRKRSKESFR